MLGAEVPFQRIPIKGYRSASHRGFLIRRRRQSSIRHHLYGVHDVSSCPSNRLVDLFGSFLKNAMDSVMPTRSFIAERHNTGLDLNSV